MIDHNINDEDSVYPSHDPKTGQPIVYVCHGLQCGRQAPYLVDRLKQVQARGYEFQLEKATCMGKCEKCPNIKFKGQITHHNTPISISKMMKSKTHRKGS